MQALYAARFVPRLPNLAREGRRDSVAVRGVGLFDECPHLGEGAEAARRNENMHRVHAIALPPNVQSSHAGAAAKVDGVRTHMTAPLNGCDLLCGHFQLFPDPRLNDRAIQAFPQFAERD